MADLALMETDNGRFRSAIRQGRPGSGSLDGGTGHEVCAGGSAPADGAAVAATQGQCWTIYIGSCNGHWYSRD